MPWYPASEKLVTSHPDPDGPAFNIDRLQPDKMRRPDEPVATARPIGRRQFLELSALGAPMIGRSSPAFQQRSVNLPVVVVGAGLAGLRAAGVLRDAGQRVVVLEARAFPGGRVQTIRTPFSEDLSAGSQTIRIPGMHKTVLKLANNHGLALRPLRVDYRGVGHLGARASRRVSRMTSGKPPRRSN